jgi:hypothetical protein
VSAALATDLRSSFAGSQQASCNHAESDRSQDASSETQVVEWVLGPIRAAWTSPDWLRHLSSSNAFYARFIDITVSSDGRAEVRRRFRPH